MGMIVQGAEESRLRPLFVHVSSSVLRKVVRVLFIRGAGCGC